MAQTFTLHFEATELAVRTALRDVKGNLVGMGLGGSTLEDTEIALAEAVNNVVEHAYEGVQDGAITIRGRLRERRLILWICDTGVAMPDGKVPVGEPVDLPTGRADLPEGGFGWFLIRHLAQAVRYDRRDGMNALALRFDL